MVLVRDTNSRNCTDERLKDEIKCVATDQLSGYVAIIPSCRLRMNGFSFPNYSRFYSETAHAVFKSEYKGFLRRRQS